MFLVGYLTSKRYFFWEGGKNSVVADGNTRESNENNECQDRRYTGQDSNWGAPEYKSTALQLS
jgi:hypothetical protein